MDRGVRIVSLLEGQVTLPPAGGLLPKMIVVPPEVWESVNNHGQVWRVMGSANPCNRTKLCLYNLPAAPAERVSRVRLAARVSCWIRTTSRSTDFQITEFAVPSICSCRADTPGSASAMYCWIRTTSRSASRAAAVTRPTRRSSRWWDMSRGKLRRRLPWKPCHQRYLEGGASSLLAAPGDGRQRERGRGLNRRNRRSSHRDASFSPPSLTDD